METIKIALGGVTDTSALLGCLKSDKYKEVVGFGKKALPMFQSTINGVSCRITIFDLSTRCYHFITKMFVLQLFRDVVIMAFDIDKPYTLGYVFASDIPKARSDYGYKPILLVGLKSELRQENPKGVSLFPFEFGQFLAHLVGAVKYVECSTKLDQDVIDVFAEAIAIRASYSGVVDSDLKNLLLSKITMADDWTDVINRREAFLPESRWDDGSEVILQLKYLDAQLCHVASLKECFSFVDFSACRSLDVDTIQLANCNIDLDIIQVKYTEPQSILWCTDQLFHVTTSNTKYLAKEVSLLKETVSLQFVKQDCRSINELIRTCGPMTVKTLVIISCIGTLVLDILPKLEGLENLVIIDTQVDLLSLEILPNTVSSLKRLVLKQCDLKQITRVGGLTGLKYLDVTCNRLIALPQTLGNLDLLQILRFNEDRVVFPPKQVLQKSAHVQDIVQFLKEFQNEPTANKDAKMMVVGQEGVGKSTLTKRLKESWFSLGKTTPPTKTDGVDISVLQFKTSNCSVYDLAGDVEYLNTHVLFFSPNCLHLVVFDLSQLPVSKEIRSSDQFCRLELWLQTIACQDPNSYAIVVGTHADHSMLSTEVLAKLRSDFDQLVDKHRSSHVTSTEEVDGCILCDKSPIDKSDTPDDDDNGSVSGSIPHILGYYEVSGITKKNVKILKSQLETSIANIKTYTSTENIPREWLYFRQETQTRLSNDDTLKSQPIVKLSQLDYLASEPVAMLRFFHSQGDFLWYEDIPEMKDVLILDPQWLSNQLCTLISYHSDVNSICEGVLHHSELPVIWSEMSQENRSKLISLFRSVGICFSVSEMEELFPFKLPVGWPDREIWSPLPKPNENQTSVLFSFVFLPPSFFTDLIVAINNKRESFPSNVQPRYYRFNVVYITKDQSLCPLHEQERQMETTDETNGSNESEQLSMSHRIHFELMPYNNRMKVTVRGPRPCCMIPDIRSTIEMVKSRRYPGISYKERLVCPECEMKKVHNPETLELDDSCEGFCSKGHDVGSIQHVLSGMLSSSLFVPGNVGQTGRTVGETLEDHFCPKLFVVLPINLDSLPLLDRFVYSYLRDGYAVHLLCESPDEWHFVSSPGFRVGKPKEFFKTYGGRVCKVLRVISALGTPFKIASAVEPHCKAGVAVARTAANISKELKALLDDYLDKYPHLKTSLGSSNDDLKDLKSSRGLQRSELSRFLDVAAKGRDFGPLTCTYVDKYDEWLWLCEEHNQKYEIVER